MDNYPAFDFKCALNTLHNILYKVNKFRKIILESERFSMKRTESIQVRLPDGGRLHLRVSLEEKEMIRSKAEAEKMTMSSIILNTLDKIYNPITVNLDDSDLRDLLIQVRRIYANVRTFLKQVGTSEHFSIKDRQKIEQQLVTNKKFVSDEYKRVRELVSKIESMNTEEAAEFAEKVMKNNLESVNDIDEHFE